MVENALKVDFDQVWDPTVTMQQLVSEAAQSDYVMGRNFEKWLCDRKKHNIDQNGKIKKGLFFAQFYHIDAYYYKESEVVCNKT